MTKHTWKIGISVFYSKNLYYNYIYKCVITFHFIYWAYSIRIKHDKTRTD